MWFLDAKMDQLSHCKSRWKLDFLALKNAFFHVILTFVKKNNDNNYENANLTPAYVRLELSPHQEVAWKRNEEIMASIPQKGSKPDLDGGLNVGYA